ncbi:hypothetical protein CYMTET_51244 [Cymbomonas tetramitiformis]|uniref:Uncharacterized protein n=1 Tax=Cymbomonas tetramitiformis TaxID=36881 RepID=A0AAE0BLN8_9CHLO|nr:hypothetical protein CYMTET_51244 [Cymbomonas tetramitiformis]
MLAYERVNTTRLELVEPEFSDEEEDLDLEKENVSPSTSNNGASSVANDTDAAPRDSDADCGKENVSETVASENGTPSIVSNIDACPTEKDAESEKENVSDPVTSNNGTSSVDNDADAAPSTSAVHQSQERADVGTPEATRAREILNDWDATGDAELIATPGRQQFGRSLARTPIIESQWNIDFTVGHLITENGEKFQIRSLTWVSKNEIKVQSECCDNPAILRVQASASHTLRMTDYGYLSLQKCEGQKSGRFALPKVKSKGAVLCMAGVIPVNVRESDEKARLKAWLWDYPLGRAILQKDYRVEGNFQKVADFMDATYQEWLSDSQSRKKRRRSGEPSPDERAEPASRSSYDYSRI